MTGSTLRRFLTLDAQLDPNLIFLLEDVAGACRAIADHIRNSAFEGNLGATDNTNVQGEAQKPLDIIANDEFMRICANSPRLAALVSEEVDDVTWLKEPEAGDYILYFDPLDGSSNLDLNLSVGSIFSVMQVRVDGDRDVLRKGADQLCAGYSVYGPSTMLVLAIGQGVQGFSLQSGTGEFRLTHPQMRVPEESAEFAINISRARHWEQPVRRYVDECLLGPDGARGKSFNMRWVASMVAEVHRILTRGGVFMYPIDDEIRAAGGRLRLMYEANPMGLVIEAAGGMASTGRARILDLPPEGHHQRVPVILGSKAEVERIVRYHSEDDARK
ncbi:MAG: class 1 fructose-bisphosphatase [Maritimibacter sp.]